MLIIHVNCYKTSVDQSLALLGLRNSPLLPQIKLDYQRCIGKTRTLKKGALNNSYTAGDEVSRCKTIKNWERDRGTRRDQEGDQEGPGGRSVATSG